MALPIPWPPWELHALSNILNDLSRYAQQFYVLYDGDNAGQQAILRIGQLCWQASIDLKVIRLPEPKTLLHFWVKIDPWRPSLDQAQDIFAFFIETIGTDFGRKPLGEKLQLTRKILEMIQKLDDPLKQDILLQNACNQLAIPFDSLKKELKRIARWPATMPKQHLNLLSPNQRQSPLIREITTLENKIFFSIMNNIQLINKENEEFLVTYLPHPLCDILNKLQEEKKRCPTVRVYSIF